VVTNTDIMQKPNTCGEGLAIHAAIPAKLAELMTSLSENLELHATSLLDDEAARREHSAYVNLVARARDIAVALRSLGDQMAGYVDLPMGGHDVGLLASPSAVQAFERYAEITRELLALLQESDARNQQMLTLMRGNRQG
jgi:hypothetical protein